jgi:hypothetical protein
MVFIDERFGLPDGWRWMELPDGPGPYRVLFEKVIPGTGTCFRPAIKN